MRATHNVLNKVVPICILSSSENSCCKDPHTAQHCREGSTSGVQAAAGGSVTIILRHVIRSWETNTAATTVFIKSSDNKGNYSYPL